MLFAFEEGFSVDQPTKTNCHLYLIGVLKYRSLNIAEVLKLRDFYKTMFKYLEGRMKNTFLAGSKVNSSNFVGLIIKPIFLDLIINRLRYSKTVPENYWLDHLAGNQLGNE